MYFKRNELGLVENTDNPGEHYKGFGIVAQSTGDYAIYRLDTGDNVALAPSVKEAKRMIDAGEIGRGS